MTAELDLADLRRRLAAASALPWAVTTCGEDDVFADRHVMDGDGCHVGTVDTDQEALVIVAAVNALPALLDRLAAAERQRDTWKEQTHRRTRERDSVTADLRQWRERAEAAEARVAALEAAARAILPAALAGIAFARAGKDGGAVMQYGAAYDGLAALLDGEA